MSPPVRRVVLAVDPGRDKCGVAVCEPGRVLDRAVVTPEMLPDLARAWQQRYGVTDVVVGNRTASQEIAQRLGATLSLPVRAVDEEGTTLRARARYFADHPPRGWRRLVPRGLLTPSEPYDDYAAVLLAESVLSGASEAAPREPRGCTDP